MHSDLIRVWIPVFRPIIRPTKRIQSLIRFHSVGSDSGERDRGAGPGKQSLTNTQPIHSSFTDQSLACSQHVREAVACGHSRRLFDVSSSDFSWAASFSRSPISTVALAASSLALPRSLCTVFKCCSVSNMRWPTNRIPVTPTAVKTTAPTIHAQSRMTHPGRSDNCPLLLYYCKSRKEGRGA